MIAAKISKLQAMRREQGGLREESNSKHYRRSLGDVGDCGAGAG
jgi:hypothetical protein